MPEPSSEEREEGHEVFPVSAENGEENPEDPRIVNEVSKQQMVVQYLKVQSSEFLETDGVSCYRNLLTFVVLTNFFFFKLSFCTSLSGLRFISHQTSRSHLSHLSTSWLEDNHRRSGGHRVSSHCARIRPE